MFIGHVSTNHGLKRNRCCKSTIMCVCILSFLFCITCEDKIAETNTNNCSKKVISFDGIHHTFQSRYVSDSQHRESSLFSRRLSSSARSRDCMDATKRHVRKYICYQSDWFANRICVLYYWKLSTNRSSK